MVYAARETTPPVVSLPPPGSVLQASLFDAAGQAESGSQIVQIVEHQRSLQAAWEAESRSDILDVQSFCRENGGKIWTDHGNFYSWVTMRDLFLGLGAGSIMANTPLDESVQDWYRDDVRSSGTDDFALFSKSFGEGQVFIPIIAGMAIVGSLYDDTPGGHLVGDFGRRSIRSYLVGAPPMLLLQYGLGGSRPRESPHGSHWKPFDNTCSVSGHAFVGAVPFITAARMTDNRCLKGGLYLCSTFTAWSRVNDDQHYMSQAFLGWWIAYLACRAVDETEFDDEHLTITPIATPDMIGVGAVYRR